MPPQPPTFSFLILLTMVLILAASAATFWLLVRRATSHRLWVALSEWSRESGFRFTRQSSGDPPEPFATLPNARPVVRMQLSKGPTTFLQFEADFTTPASSMPPSAPSLGSATPLQSAGARSGALTWNVVTRRLEVDWPPTGLRPAHAERSVLDLFSLSSFPTLGATDRFVAFGTDSAAARAVSKSMLRSLLPADVGLLLHGHHLVLDFSTRPFDSMELSRIAALLDQLAAHLPQPP